MSDAFSSAISGISSNATRAAVAANNIANANTSGFKASSITVESSGSGRQKTHITKSTEPGSLLPDLMAFPKVQNWKRPQMLIWPKNSYSCRSQNMATAKMRQQ